MTYPKVLTELETIKLMSYGKSIARFGDGELNLCFGIPAKAQEPHPSLASRLRCILKHPGDCIVGIPRIADLSEMTEQKQQFWGKYQDQKWVDLYDLNHTYGSAFITRPDSAPSIDRKSYFPLVKKLWEGREVILINGTQQGQRFDENKSILDNCSFKRWGWHTTDAWRSYNQLLNLCKRESKEKIFILALGPTATVLAYDLGELGYTAWDMGHFGMFFAGIR